MAPDTIRTVERVVNMAREATLEAENAKLRADIVELRTALRDVVTWCEVNNRKGSVLYTLALKALGKDQR